MNIIIVIPAYNEEERISKLLTDLIKLKIKIIVVDDGSKDNTRQILNMFEKRYKLLKFLRHKVNLGKGEALKTGCEYAFLNGAEAVILMDADGQHETADLPKFINVLKEGKAQIAYGVRSFKGDIPLERFLANKLISVEINVLFGVYLSDILCGFRAFTKEAYKLIKWRSSGYAVESEMIIRGIKHKLKFVEVDVATVYYEKYKGVSLSDFFQISLSILYFKFRI